MWMNGNVTADGITRDLQAMKRAGLGGALIFNIGEFIPKGPVDYGKQEWLDLMTHAARESDRLGLELAMHNCPGWSSSGGPWITPEMSMQRLVWSETKVVGGTNLNLRLPRPFTRLNFYRDISVLAFPSLPGEEKAFAESLVSIRNSSEAIEKSLLTDGDLDTMVQASPDNPLVLEFPEPFTARAITVLYTSGGGTIGFNLESSDDGTNFKPVVRLSPVTPRAIEDASLVETFEPVSARFFRVIPSRPRGVCEIELHAAPRIPAWNYKANHSFRSARQEGTSRPVTPEFTIDPERIENLTGLIDADGRLSWNAPAGNWTIVRFGHTPRGQENIAAPDAGIGLECDKMSRKATAFHFEHGLGPLMKALGSLAGKAFTGIEIDSYEVGVQNWTAGFENEFREINGYDITKYLPSMTGRYVGDAEVSERFLWDLRRTHARLVADCYYGELREIGAKHGLRLFAEPYGAGPGAYDELQIAGRVDVPMGEFWAHFPWDDMSSIRLAASAAHVHGRTLVAGEAFTSTEEQSRFLDYPFALKATGDLAFSLGLNQMYFHRYAHQPHPSALPGMTMGPWGFNFDRNNTWFEKSSGWLAYLARSQFMLQQGGFLTDVLYFTGEGSPQMSKRIVPEMLRSFQFDAVDAEVLLKGGRVENGRIQLAGGASYRLLALPPGLESMTPELLRKLRDLVSNGATLVGSKPRFSPTLRGYPASETEFQQIADKLWPGAGESRNPVTVGRGTVYPSQTISDVLAQLNVLPDFEFTGREADAEIVWLHRRVGDADVYFVANRQRRDEEVLCSFRVVGKQPELWRPESGVIEMPALYDSGGGRTRLPLRLKPSESVFVVFRKPADSSAIAWVARDGIKLIETDFAQILRDRESVASDHNLTNHFTITAWIKPDSDMMGIPQEGGSVAENGKGWVVPPPEGDRLHGAGHSALGIAAGRNAVLVAERTTGKLVATLVSRTALSGWTHLALVCRNGKPGLYLNGKLDREGRASGSIVHPGVGAAPDAGKTIYYFDGDMTKPEVSREVFTAEQISALAASGLPDAEMPAGIKIRRSRNGGIEANVWQPGKYTLANGRSIEIGDLPAPVELNGPWHLDFPEGLGAPRHLILTNLVSLRMHGDSGVRHFSGTAAYQTTFELNAESLGNRRRHWLDLGRVAVIAQVRVNGVERGLLWNPPYRVEITDALRPGKNQVELRVTTLLANRMIGDEALPIENEYNPRTRAIVRFPDWYRAGEAKPAGGRVTFSAWRFFNPGDPLVESGLLGPVRILTSASAEF
jgi:hypothetical protein